jgi:hypothetical protein
MSRNTAAGSGFGRGRFSNGDSVCLARNAMEASAPDTASMILATFTHSGFPQPARCRHAAIRLIGADEQGDRPALFACLHGM